MKERSERMIVSEVRNDGLTVRFHDEYYQKEPRRVLTRAACRFVVCYPRVGGPWPIAEWGLIFACNRVAHPFSFGV